METVAEKEASVETPGEYEFEESIGYWIVLTAQAYQKALSDEVAPQGITFRQSQVLGWLALEGELSQVELAARMMIEPATLVGVLDRMERDRLLKRVAAPGDRRRKLIRLSSEADAVWSKVAQCARRIRARASDGLSPRQIKTLKGTLQKVMDNLSDSAVHRRKLNSPSNGET